MGLVKTTLVTSEGDVEKTTLETSEEDVGKTTLETSKVWPQQPAFVKQQSVTSKILKSEVLRSQFAKSREIGKKQENI
jgi:hypothetical protein